jgi:hypothetical protein
LRLFRFFLSFRLRQTATSNEIQMNLIHSMFIVYGASPLHASSYIIVSLLAGRPADHTGRGRGRGHLGQEVNKDPIISQLNEIMGVK